LTRLVRFAHPADREVLVDAVTRQAEALCLPVRSDRYRLSPEVLADARLGLRGHAVFDRQDTPAYTTINVWQAEDRLMRMLDCHAENAPYLDEDAAVALVDSVDRSQRAARGFGLADDQRAAAVAVLAGRQQATAVVGPAGTGKTTSMRAVRQAWEQVYGPGSVVGLATSGLAAYVLGEQLGIETSTIAKWLYETGPLGRSSRRQRIEALRFMMGRQARAEYAQALADEATYQIRRGDLVIVDEASMTGTLGLSLIGDQVAAAGAKLLLVGDPQQLDSPAAGGLLGWADRQGLAAQLTSLWRFEEQWMATASLQLRAGLISGVDAYDQAGMIHSGLTDDMREAAYQAALTDLKRGVAAVLVAASNADVVDLAQRTSLDLRAAGLVDSSVTVALSGGLDAGLGERILSRHTDRQVCAGQTPMYNGTFMVVRARRADGSVIAWREDTNEDVVLPGEWVSAYCELGYAVTAHRAQGVTVDHSYLVVDARGRMPRELFYVAMTRGRKSNHAYVGLLSREEALAAGIDANHIPDGRRRIAQILAGQGAEKTAHEVVADVRREEYSLERLVAEHEYLASLVDGPACARYLERINRFAAGAAQDAPAWPALVASWRRAVLVSADETADRLADPLVVAEIDDVAALLQSRIAGLADRAEPASRNDPRWVAGVVPRIESTDAGVIQVARQCEALIEARIAALESSCHDWEASLPPRPGDEGGGAAWDVMRLAVACYRDRWAVTTQDALGPTPAVSLRQQRDWQAAKDALDRFGWIALPPDEMLAAWDLIEANQLFEAPPPDSSFEPPPESVWPTPAMV
jgi:hypothetical protein